MLYRILKSYYVQFGGKRVIRIYAKMGVIWPMLKAIVTSPFNEQSYKKAYSVALKKIELLLQEKYAPLMVERKGYYACQTLQQETSKIVWFCWLQGIEKAPAIVQTCLDSLRNNLTDREIVIIDAGNWKEYVTLPEHIVQRWENRQIPPAHFSDLIRLQLLIKYGGIWIDSTVLCTGITEQNKQETTSFLDANLFMFQYTRPSTNQWGGRRIRGTGTSIHPSRTLSAQYIPSKTVIHVYA